MRMQDGGAREVHETGAIREPTTGKGAFELISPFMWIRLALWYEGGSHKYAPRNWEKGFKFSRLIQSTLRHIVKWIIGMRDEDHLAAAIWNLAAIIHFEEIGRGEELNDMPNYIEQYGNPNMFDSMVERYGFKTDEKCEEEALAEKHPIERPDEQTFDIDPNGCYQQDSREKDMVKAWNGNEVSTMHVHVETMKLLDSIKPIRNHGWRKYDIYAIDFDGCLCANKWPEIGEPNEALINFIKVRKAQGDKFILWTCREGKLLDDALAWCEKHGLHFDSVNRNLPEMNEYYGNDSRKIGCDFILDDKAISMIYEGN